MLTTEALNDISGNGIAEISLDKIDQTTDTITATINGEGLNYNIEYSFAVVITNTADLSSTTNTGRTGSNLTVKTLDIPTLMYGASSGTSINLIWTAPSYLGKTSDGNSDAGLSKYQLFNGTTQVTASSAELQDVYILFLGCLTTHSTHLAFVL